MPSIKTAQVGDTLCGLAIQAGFLNCDPIRNDPANQGKSFLTSALKEGEDVTVPDIRLKESAKASEATHTFRKKNAPPIDIRFVHGSPNLPYRDDPSIDELNVSNFPTNKAGPTAASAFPRGHEFNQAGHDDPDTFKVEVVDPQAGNTLQVELEILQPVYKADGSLDKNQPFAAADQAGRKRNVTCTLVRNSVCHRSEYHRLVVDTQDLNAAPDQTLLASDLADGADGDRDKVEILDQIVQVGYSHANCSAATKCLSTFTAKIGNDHKRVRLAVHILQDAAKTPVATKPLTRKRVLNYVRQLYAQADMALKFVDPIREVPLPANLFAIANANGRRAVGAKTIKVRVRIDPAVDEEASVTTVANETPFQTAERLRDALVAKLPVGTKVVASDNPPLVGQAIGSADVLVGDPLTQTIQLNILQNDDANHPVRVGQLTSTTVVEFGGADGHVGTIEERVLVKNYDTGTDRIDLFIVGALSAGSCGEAFSPSGASPANQRPSAEMLNSALVFVPTVNQVDHFHTTIPHEMGHILMDVVHAHLATEMMGQGSPVGANERVVNGPKRISDPRTINYDGGVSGVPVKMLRDNNPAIVEGW